MITNVLAAFLSLLLSPIVFFLLRTTGLGDASIVVNSGSKPLTYDVFSGDEFELTVVNAVVVVSKIKLFLLFYFIKLITT